MKRFLVSYLGADKPGLIGQFTRHISDANGSFGEVSFSSVDAAAEITCICVMDKQSAEELQTELAELPALKGGDLRVKEVESARDRGLTSRVTHRFVLQGADKAGFLAQVVEALDKHGAIIVRMSTEILKGTQSDAHYIARFGVSIMEGRAPECIATIAGLASEHNCTFRYETA